MAGCAAGQYQGSSHGAFLICGGGGKHELTLLAGEDNQHFRFHAPRRAFERLRGRKLCGEIHDSYGQSSKDIHVCPRVCTLPQISGQSPYLMSCQTGPVDSHRLPTPNQEVVDIWDPHENLIDVPCSTNFGGERQVDRYRRPQDPSTHSRIAGCPCCGEAGLTHAPTTFYIHICGNCHIFVEGDSRNAGSGRH